MKLCTCNNKPQQLLRWRCKPVLVAKCKPFRRPATTQWQLRPQAFATPSSISVDDAVARLAGRLPAPPPLPPTPTSSTVTAILPVLLRTAVVDKAAKWRIAAAATLLILSKVTGLMAPLFLKHSVDALGGTSPVTHRAALAATSALLMWGLCRTLNSLAKELQGPVFTPVAQGAARRMSFHVFSHVLDLDVGFHLERRTGVLSRVLERGTWGMGDVRGVLAIVTPRTLCVR